MTHDQPVVTLDCVLRRRLDVRIRRYRGRLLTANPHGAFELDEVAAFIVTRADGRAPLSLIAAELAREPGWDAYRAGVEATELARQLVEHRVLEPVPRSNREHDAGATHLTGSSA